MIAPADGADPSERHAEGERPPLASLNDALVAALRSGPVLTPTLRLARELDYAVNWQRQRAKDIAWRTPAVMSWSAFLERGYAEAQDAGLAGAQAVLLPDRIALFAMARSAPKAAWARHVHLFAEAWRIAKLHGIRTKDPALRQTDNGTIYARWAQAFEKLLDDQGWITTPQLPDRLTRLADWCPPVPTALTFAGLAPAERRFLVACRGEVADFFPDPQRPMAVTAQRVVAGDQAEERGLAAVWARERLSADERARVGIVLPNLGAEFPAIERRFHALFPDVPDAADYVNVSGGLTLAQTPVCRDALEFLEFTAAGADRARLRALAQSPFLRLGLPVEGLPDHASLPAAAKRHRKSKLRPIVAAVAATGGRTPRVALLRRLLRLAGWPGSSLDSGEFQAKQLFEECLSAFAFAEKVARFRDWATAVAGLRQLAETSLFAPRTAHAPIQVLGRAESIGLTFDHLWLAGLDQATWPPVPTPNPLLPLARQRLAGVPALSFEAERKRAAAVTRHWLRAATRVVASHAGEDAAPSALTSAFAAVAANAAVGQPALAANGHPWAVATSIRLESAVDDNAEPLATTKQRGGAAVLEAQSLCPFRAWARHRLGVREPTTYSRFPNAAERGAVVHRILADLLTAHRTQSALAELKAGAVAKAVAETLEDYPRWPDAYRRLEAKRLEKLVADWLAFEAQRPPFAVVAVEHDMAANIAGLELELRIDRIDRLDATPNPASDRAEMASPALLLIDFKTGRSNARAWLPPRPTEPQLPLYAVTFPDDVSAGDVCGIAFVTVRPDGCRRRGVMADGAPADLTAAGKFAGKSFAELRADWQTALAALARDYIAGRAAVDPVGPQACGTCHLHALCRVRDGA